MEFKKPSGKSFQDTALLAGGAFAGGFASRVAIGLIHKPTANSEDTAALKKEENMLLAKRGGIMLASLVAMTSVGGKDEGATIVRGTFLGMAVVQGLEAIKSLASKSSIAAKSAIVSDALGLGCSCNGINTLNAPFTPRYTPQVIEAKQVDFKNAILSDPMLQAIKRHAA